MLWIIPQICGFVISPRHLEQLQHSLLKLPKSNHATCVNVNPRSIYRIYVNTYVYITPCLLIYGVMPLFSLPYHYRSGVNYIWYNITIIYCITIDCNAILYSIYIYCIYIYILYICNVCIYIYICITRTTFFPARYFRTKQCISLCGSPLCFGWLFCVACVVDRIY